MDRRSAWLFLLSSFFLLSISTPPCPAAGEPLRTAGIVEHLTIRDGLSQTTIRDLHQDRRGFLWIATVDGLNRYDGYEFKVYRHDPEDPTSLPGNEVFGILEDGDGSLWLATRTAGLSHFDPRREVFTNFKHDPDDPTSLVDDRVHVLESTEDGDLWIGTAQGLSRLDRETGHMDHVRTGEGIGAKLRSDWVVWLEADSHGGLWIGTYAGLYRLDLESRSLKDFGDYPALSDVAHVVSIFEAGDGDFWIGTRVGLLRYSPETDTFFRWRHDPADPYSLPDDHVVDLLEDESGALWVATKGGGLGRYDALRDRFENLKHRADDPGSLSSNSLLSMTLDRDGILWAGSYVGIDKIDRRKTRFRNYRHLPGTEHSLVSNNVWPIWQDREGILWVGTYDRGLNRIDRESGTVTRYAHRPEDPSSLAHGTVESLYEDRQGRFWVGTREGLSRMDRETGRFVDPWHSGGASARFPRVEVFSMAEDAAGRFWVGTIGVGLVLFDRDAERVEAVYGFDPNEPHSLSQDAIYDIVETGDGRLWVGTLNGGLNRFDPATGKAERFRHDPDDPRSLAGERGVILHRDRQGELWIGTQSGGLSRYLGDGRGFESFSTAEGLPSDSVLGILEDEAGRLWLSTYNGLARFNPRDQTVVHFTEGDGLPGNSFSPTSYFQAPSGEMFFGGTRGLTTFFPDQVEPDEKAPNVVLTELRLFDQPVEPGPGSVLPQTLESSEKIELGHEDYVFSIRFSALHFQSPEHNRFAYRLQGFDPDWIEVGAGERIARYSNLAPGTYTFEVKSASPHGVWSAPERLTIVQHPAPWNTWWAWTLYGLTILTGAFLFVRLQTRRLAKERQINARLREVDTLKNELLANTSHELRTPLFAMIGITEALMEGSAGPLSDEVKGDLGTVVAGGRRLARLVDDLLDYSKLKSTHFELERAAVPLHALTDVVLTLARPLAREGVELVNAVSPDLDAADGDEERLHQVLFNLVSNSAKFTESGSVRVSAERRADGFLEVAVTDTGIGIAAQDQDKIFQAFTQADSSTRRVFGGAGLGLAICRRLVEMHGGEMWVESTLGAGSTFRFTLPVAVGLAASSGTFPESPLPTRVLTSGVGPRSVVRRAADKPRRSDLRILVVDDEEMILRVVGAFLDAEGYDYLTASDGDEALRLVEEDVVDLILLDVMMPRLSGFEVCREIRRHHALEELPILFLSAKTEPEDISAGFAEGGNDYLTKPVSRDELTMRLETHLKLLEAHRARQEEVKILRGLLPICSSCKKIRNEEQQWENMETYIHSRSEARFTHGICPDCAVDFVPVKPH